MTLLYEQRKGTRENSSTREVLISRYSVVVGVKTRRWNAKQAGDLYDDQLPRESWLLAGVVTNRMDIIFDGGIREVQGLTPDPRTALSQVITEFQSWQEDAQFNPWWPSSITQPKTAPSLDLSFDGNRINLHCYSIGKVLVSVPTMLSIGDTQLSVIVAIRGEVPPNLVLHQIVDPMDVELGSYPRLLLSA